MKCFNSNCKENFSSFKYYLNHFNVFHKFDNFFICINCDKERSFTNSKSFKNHMIQHFKTLSAALNTTLNVPTPKENENGLNDNIPIHCEINEQNNNFTADLNHNTKLSDVIEQLNCALVEDLYSIQNINRKDVQSIITLFCQYNKEIVSLIDDHVRVDTKEVETNQLVLSILSQFKTSFSKISTEYKRIKELKKNPSYIEPKTVIIGERVDNYRKENKLLPQTINVEAILNPIKPVLENFFHNTKVLNSVFGYLKSLELPCTDISSFIQTTFWNEKTSNYNKHDIVLPIILYFDEFETNNALGSRAGLQNLGAVYISLPFIPKTMQSKLENIFLVMLFHSLDRKKYGNSVFQPVVDELLYLETTGIEINNQRFFIILAACVGDNKGLNGMLGFTESFTAHFFCRFCKMPKSETQKCDKQCSDVLRNRSNYIDDVAKNNVSETGIIGDCIFNQLENFNVTENFSVDIMHDMLEGILNYEIALILDNFINKNKYFKLEQLNSRIANFDFGEYENINKPQYISNDHLKSHKLRYSSSETLWLAKFLGVMIGEFIPEKDGKWEIFILLRQILEIVLQDHINLETIDYLEYLISRHHKTFQENFQLPLRPKHHFLCHYPYVMKKMGPLKQFWCMRFEGKHKILKNIARSTTSRRNICKTISQRLSLASVKFAEITDKVEFGKNVVDRAFNYFESVIINKKKYKKNRIIQLNGDSNSNEPIFFRILGFLKNENGFLSILGYKYEILYFDYHTYAYVVKEKSKIETYQFELFKNFTDQSKVNTISEIHLQSNIIKLKNILYLIQ